MVAASDNELLSNKLAPCQTLTKMSVFVGYFQVISYEFGVHKKWDSIFKTIFIWNQWQVKPNSVHTWQRKLCKSVVICDPVFWTQLRMIVYSSFTCIANDERGTSRRQENSLFHRVHETIDNYDGYKTRF